MPSFGRILGVFRYALTTSARCLLAFAIIKPASREAIAAGDAGLDARANHMLKHVAHNTAGAEALTACEANAKRSASWARVPDRGHLRRLADVQSWPT